MIGTIGTEESIQILYLSLILFALQSANFTILLKITPCLPCIQLRNIISSLHDKYQQIQEKTTKLFVIHEREERSSLHYTKSCLQYLSSGSTVVLLYVACEIGNDPTLSWMGVIVYFMSMSIVSSIVLCIMTPCIRHWMEAQLNESKETNTKDYSYLDFVTERFGPMMKWFCTIMDIMSKAVSLSIHMTIVSYIYSLLNGKHQKLLGAMPSNSYFLYPIFIAASISFFTMAYSLYKASLPCNGRLNTLANYESYYCEKIKGVGLIVISFILLMNILSLDISKLENGMNVASMYHNMHDIMIITGVFSIGTISRTLLDTKTWKHVSNTSKAGCIIGNFALFLVLTLFGMCGMVVYAIDPTPYDTFEKLGFASFLDLIPKKSLITFIILTILCISAVDRLQWTLCHRSTSFRFVTLALVNTLAIYLSIKQYNILNLLLLSDLTYGIMAFPILFGLLKPNVSISTDLGAFLGCISGIATVFLMGLYYENDFFEYFWKSTGQICVYCSKTTLYLFMLVPFVSFLCAVIFSLADFKIRGNKVQYYMKIEKGVEDDEALQELAVIRRNSLVEENNDHVMDEVTL